MSSHFILFHHFRPFNSVPFHFIHSISFHVIHLIPVYLSFIPLLSSIPSFNYSLIPFHPIRSHPMPCPAIPSHSSTHTLSLSIWGFAEMGETHIIKINETIYWNHSFGDPHESILHPANQQPFPSESLRARNPGASGKLAAMRDGPAAKPRAEPGQTQTARSC